MNKLWIACAVFALGLWVWSEFFRAIPHLEQSGVLKNFKVTQHGTHQAEYRVIDTRYYSPKRRSIHPASPVVGSFNDLAYVSNVDLLLAPPNLNKSMLKQVNLEQARRCYQVESSTLVAAELEKIRVQVLNLSVIAATQQAADQIRRLKSGQRIVLQGAWVEVESAKTTGYFSVGLGSASAAQCKLFQVNQIQVLD